VLSGAKYHGLAGQHTRLRRGVQACFRKACVARALAGLVVIPGLAFASHTHGASLQLAENGTTRFVIVHAEDATTAERRAARELATHLREITGAEFPVESLQDDRVPRRAILVGASAAARRWFRNVPWEQLGDEEIVIQARGSRLLLAGGRPRGTMYAVSRFLQDQCGVRWWTPWASRIPREPNLRVSREAVRASPAFEARDPFWYCAFDPEWATRNFSNSQSAKIPADWGGDIRYKGFVHTFYALVPPAEHFGHRPEWFSMVKGRRTHARAQLCLTNPELREHVVARVREWLRESPEASIVSISQNDWYGACECPVCSAVDAEEGSHAGTLLQFVNHVAAELENEFPTVAFDTLAYQYTRKPPRTLRPRSNVIVRLCSIECNFHEPLDGPANAAFGDDLRGWSKISPRLYVWDYTTDFAHYVQPHPNWFVLGPNLRFFHQHNVRGMFEQGAYQSHGAEMAELRAWVLAQLMWNPYQDDRTLLREFVEGYYGPAAAPFVLEYLAFMHNAARGVNLTCFAGTEAPHHTFTVLARAENLWRMAEEAASASKDHEMRVMMSRRPLWYVWLSRWDALRKECGEARATWPMPDTRAEAAEQFRVVARGFNGVPWTKITHLNESGLTPDQFVARITRKEE
jgi:hypothetical protein